MGLTGLVDFGGDVAHQLVSLLQALARAMTRQQVMAVMLVGDELVDHHVLGDDLAILELQRGHIALGIE